MLDRAVRRRIGPGLDRVAGPLHTRGVRPGQVRAPGPEGDLQAQAVARDDRQAELRVVDPAQERGRTSLGTVHQEKRGDLRERLDHQHAGHQRRTREMPLKEVLVDRDVLHGHDASPRLELRHRIHER